MSETGLEIAVIGMSGRFPGARDVREFWENLKNGIESLCFFSDEELEGAGIDSELIGDPNYVKSGGGILEDTDHFDAAFFDYTPNEALVMHPQARIFHECAWEALENAGYAPGSFKGKIGVYAGASTSSRWETLTAMSGKTMEIGRFAAASLSNKDFLSTRIAYKLNLKGPGFVMQTACSTSLVAVDLACRGIWTGQCDMALAGGVSISGNRSPSNPRGYLYREGLIRSPDGHCRAFDAKAKGTADGEGAGIVVLKLLEDAVSDGDTVYAVIKGSAVNNDGNRKVGFTAPSIEGQAEVIRAAHMMAEVPPETITYIEAHGTGTPLGDPVEIEALKQGFGTGKKGFCRIGSVKTNVGHLDAAAGIAGLIKTVFALKHRQIPPSLHFETPNPGIDLENSPFRVCSALTPWENGPHPRRAGVSAFGIGGTNAHVVLEEWPDGHPSDAEHKYQLLLLSAKTETALDKMTRNLVNYLEKDITAPNFADVAYTLQVGRNAFGHRKMLVCSTVDEAVEALSTPGSDRVFSYSAKEKSPPVIFMFPGQGSQYVRMGLDLYRNLDTFRREMDRCFKILAPLTEDDPKEMLYPNVGTSPVGPPRGGVNETEIAQPLIFAVEYALAKVLIEWGIQPYAMIGHSIGEYVAAHLSGVFSLEDALKIVTLRGKLMQRLPSGTMLGVSLSPGELGPLLESHPELSLAAVNSPSNCTVSGPHAAAAEFERHMQSKGYPCRKLHTSHAFHSAMMDPVLKPFEDELRRISLHKPTIPYLSNVTGNWKTDADAVDPAYWVRHLRHTVRFADGIGQVINKMDVLFLEVGPGRVLSTFVTKWARPGETPGFLALNLVRHPDEEVSDLYFLYREIGRMWLYGREIQWPLFHKNARRIPLPAYPFEGLPFRIDQTSVLSGRGRQLLPPGQRPPLDQWFYLPDWKRSVLTRGGVSPVPSTRENDRWLVFLDSRGLGDRLVSRLHTPGHPAATVTPGTEFNASGRDGGPYSYTINPRRPGDYLELFQHLAARGETPNRLLHLWGITGPEPHQTGERPFPGHFEEAQFLGYYSLLSIAGAVEKTGTGASRPFRLDVVADYLFDVAGQEDPAPEKSTMMGALTVIPQEHPNIRCRAVDILLPGDGSPGNPRWEMPVKQILEEILTERETVDLAAAYRGPHRLVRHYEPLPLEAVTGEAEKNLPLREKGVYVITGGLGKIGLTLARYLARDYRARLVLIDRTDQPGEKETQKIAELHELGAEVSTFGADIADEEQMRTVLHDVEQRWGAVNGVIHCAGILRGRTFDLAVSLDPPLCMEQFRPKVYGTLVLEKLFLDRSLDFCWFMSSVSAILGGLRFSAYAAANACMDALVTRAKRRTETGMNWISVDWDGLTPKETVDAFKRILSLPLHHVDRLAVSNGGDLQGRIDRWIKLETVEEKTGTLHPRPQLFNPYMAPSTETQRALAGIWQRIFGFDRVGIRDDFFQLGGDSLKAVTVIAAIHKQLTVEIPLPVFFTNPTVEKMAEYIDRTGTGTYTGIPPAEKKEYYALSPAQMRLFILQQMDTESTAYNEMQWTTLEGPVDPAAIRDIFARLIRRHDIYRTSITFVEGRPVQRVHAFVDFDLQFSDVSDVSSGGGDTGENVGRVIAAFRKPFDTANPPLLRAILVKAGDRRHVLAIDQHHLVTDGISHHIFLREIAALHEGKELPPPRLQYKDYTEWLNGPLRRAALQKQETYWLEQFRDEVPVLELPIDYPRPAVRGFEGRTAGFSLTEEETRGLHSLAAREDATLYMVLLSMVNVLCAKLSGREDIVLGTVVAGRRHEDLHDIIGMFVNTLALRNRPSGERPFSDFLKEVKANTLDAFENQEYPFELLVEKVDVVKDTGRNPLFDVMFVQQTQAEKDNGGAASEGWKPAIDRIRAVKFDLTLEGIESEGRLKFKMEYRTQLFKPETVTRFIAYFKNIVTCVPDNPGAAICDIDILPAEEKQRLLYEFNDTTASYPPGKTIHRLFEEQARRTPDAVALYAPYKTDTAYLTYKELNRDADRLARLLQSKNVEPDNVVALYAGRSVEMIAGILGILKAGGAYLPIDTGYPEERTRFMLTDSNTKIVLSDNGKMGGWEGEVINISTVSGSLPASGKPRTAAAASNFAYIIYTSGTTGRPKGVVIRHRNVVQLMVNDGFLFDFNECDVWTLFHSYCFDFSVWEMYGALLYGGKLVVIPKMAARDTQRYLEILKAHRVTVLNQTPSAFYQLMDLELKHPRKDLSIRYVIFGGEALNPSRLKQWKTRYPSAAPVNMYGITETTVHVTFKEITGKEIGDGTSNIGHPIPLLTAYIMDKHLKLMPTGAAGELCVGGDGVGMGYLNRPELTHEKFVENPYKPGELLYRSGDLARLSADGELEYRGRIDHQVKIRGFRIELGEIENRLSSHRDIRESVVIAGEDRKGDKYICAYFVPVHDAPAVSVTALRDYLSGLLPGYMVPSYFVPLERIPLTSNGKVDRRSLPRPEFKAGEDYVPPVDDVETALTRIWSEVLEIPQDSISTGAGFFDLGGHSLRATVAVSKIHKEFNVKMPLVQIFKTPTIRELARCIKGNVRVQYASIQPAEKKEYYPLSPAQKRMYILQQMDPGNVNYNMPQFIPMAPGIDGPRLESAFQRIVARHESLRTSFIMVEGEPVQRVHDNVEFKLEFYDEDPGLHPFDLSQAPLLRAGIAAPGENRCLLIVDTHHIISDGISQVILMEEFQALYNGGELSPLPLQYKDYAQWLTREEQQEATRFQEAYWLREFSGEIPVLALPLDYPRPAVRSFKGRTVYFSLTAAETLGLNALASREEATLYMVLSAAFNILLSKLSGSEDIVIGTAAAGRRHADLERIIGMFVNTLPLRNFPSGEQSFGSFLNKVKERTLTAFENQDYPFEKLVENAAVAKDVGRNPLFDVMFILQNIADRKSKDPDPLPGNREKPVYEDQVAKFDLTITCIEAGDRLKFGFQYSTRLFKEETVQRFTAYFKKIVTSVLADTEKTIRDIDILSEEEKERILVDFNRTESSYPPYPEDATIHAMFEDMARRVPDRVALVEGDKQLTYRALDETADRRASELSVKSVKKGDIVAVSKPRSIELIAALLGILKAGAAYLPMDPGYPEERIRYILADSNAKTHIDSRRDAIYRVRDQFEADKPHPYTTGPQNLAYVIYTSGTTGRPKGVPVPHRGFVNLVYYHREVFGEGPGTRMSQVANPGFDAMAFEVWPCLSSGAALYIADEEARPDPVKMKAWLIRMGITISFQSTVMAEQLLDEPWPESGAALNALLTAGDRLTRYPAHPYPFTLYNLYGPTEDTVWTTWTEVPVTPEAKGFPPIGKPVANHRVYITGPNMEVQPVGVPGELCITGAGLAPGYLNNPELTAQKFCRGAAPSLMSAGTPGPLTPLYKTGDIARWLADGPAARGTYNLAARGTYNLEFMGRIDGQVKLRGFRIETGEIEQRLLSHENVKEAVVVLKKDNRTREYLCAYVVPTAPLPETAGLREYLAAALPGYMVPSFFVQLEKIPLTPNGKIDRGALPEPEIGTSEQYIAPRDEVEKELTEIWAGVLGIEREAVGIDANFFDLGGHSLSIIKMNAGIKERLNKSIPVVTLFRLSTVRTLAAYIREEEISLQAADEILEDSVETMDETLSILMEDDDE